MKSALILTIFRNAINTFPYNKRVVCRAPLEYYAENNWFKIDEEMTAMNLVCCGTYMTLKNIIGSKYVLNKGGCYR